MRPQIAHLAAALGAAALAAGSAGCGSGGADPPERTISFQAPSGGALKARADDMRRAAQLELDAIGGDTAGSRLKLVDGPDPKAIASIDALARVPLAGPRQLTVSLAPPLRRETGAVAAVGRRPQSAPVIRLLPPDTLNAAAARSYAASGAPGSAGAKTDSPLVPGTPRGLYVTAALAEGSYPPAGEDFFDKFNEAYGRAPDRYAIYGYEAVGLIVDALNRLEEAGEPVTQRALAGSALSIRNRFSPVGHYDVLPSGQTTLYVFQGRGKRAPEGPASIVEALR